MTLRDYFAIRAASIVEDSYAQYQIKAWFGERIGIITREEVRAKAAYSLADAMLAERAKGGGA